MMFEFNVENEFGRVHKSKIKTMDFAFQKNVAMMYTSWYFKHFKVSKQETRIFGG